VSTSGGEVVWSIQKCFDGALILSMFTGSAPAWDEVVRLLGDGFVRAGLWETTGAKQPSFGLGHMASWDLESAKHS